MAKIYIEPTKAKQSVTNEEKLSKLLEGLSQDVDNIRGNLRYKISGKEQISARLAEVVQQIRKESNSVKALSSGLEQIISQYVQTEDANRDRLAADKASSVQESGGETGTQQEEDSVWDDLLEEIIGAILGPFGFLTDTSGLLDGGLADFTTYLLGGIGSITELISTEGVEAEWLKELFGLNPMESVSVKGGFWDELANFDSVTEGIGTAVGWLTELIGSGVENFAEFGGDWCARFWEETLVESGIKIAEGAAVTAGVSAVVTGVCAAAGVACPPALVIGVAAAGIGVVLDLGLDSIVSWATNGSCTSWVEGASDLICDGIDAIREGVGTLAEKTGQAVEKAAETVVETGKKVVDSIYNTMENLFGEVKWAQGLFA